MPGTKEALAQHVIRMERALGNTFVDFEPGPTGVYYRQLKAMPKAELQATADRITAKRNARREATR